MATTLPSPSVAQPFAPAIWSNILKQPPPEQQQQRNKDLRTIEQSGLLVGSCNSSKGIAVAVVDANAIIHGGEKLSNTADRFVSIDEVINEIRDPASRHSLNLLPFTVDTIAPSSDAIKKVISFAKATGDLQTLSDVDLKLIALTYMLEIQIHGTQHLRDSPPPIQTLNVKRLPEKDLPGWGDNVTNLAEWEALAHAADNKPNPNSRILPVKDLNLDTSSPDVHNTEDGLSQVGSELHSGDQGDSGFVKPRRYTQKKKEIKLKGKMLADGIDASKGEFGDNADDWLPAVSRSTHRKFLRRKARREMNEALSESADQQEESRNVENENRDDTECPDLVVDESYEEMIMGVVRNESTEDQEISASFNNMKLGDLENGLEKNVPSMEIEPNGVDSTLTAEHEEGNEIMSSQANEDDDTLHMDELSSEQSWMLRSLSESSVACVTSDYAMQNLLLQMGLRLLAPGGMQIRELHRWVLKCHACFKVTTETGRIFCPSCGNGGTLRKVAVTVGENGIVLAARRPRLSLRGTKFSIPMPQGGRDAVTKNPILREDQLPQKFLYPKTKKNNKKEQDFFIPDDIFRHHNDKKAPHQPPVRKALAVFSGKRNPNDNHYARPKC